jgi:hypothetical protein
MKIAVVALALATPMSAWVQQGPAVILPPRGPSCYVVLPPPGSGQSSTSVMPTPEGGWQVIQFGKPSTFVLPQGSGPQPFPLLVP